MKLVCFVQQNFMFFPLGILMWSVTKSFFYLQTENSSWHLVLCKWYGKEIWKIETNFLFLACKTESIISVECDRRKKVFFWETFCLNDSTYNNMMLNEQLRRMPYRSICRKRASQLDVAYFSQTFTFYFKNIFLFLKKRKASNTHLLGLSWNMETFCQIMKT